MAVTSLAAKESWLVSVSTSGDHTIAPGQVDIFRSSDRDRVVARIFIYIDNFLVVAGSRETRDEIADAVEAGARGINAVWKIPPLQKSGLRRVDPNRQDCTERKIVQFIGVAYSCSPAKVDWSLSRDFLDKWRASLEDIKSTTTMAPREAYAVAGALIWAVRVLLEPLVRARAVIQLIRHMSTKMASARGKTSEKALWDAELEVGHLTPQVSKLAVEILEHPGASRTTRGRETIILATDASGWGFAICRRGEDGNWYVVEMGQWTQEQAAKEIKWRELWVMVRAVTQLHTQCKDVVLLGNNSTAVAALRRGISDIPDSDEMVEQCWEVCSQGNLQLRPHWIPTHAMPADGPSRGSDIVREHVTQVEKILKERAIIA